MKRKTKKTPAPPKDGDAPRHPDELRFEKGSKFWQARLMGSWILTKRGTIGGRFTEGMRQFRHGQASRVAFKKMVLQRRKEGWKQILGRLNTGTLAD